MGYFKKTLKGIYWMAILRILFRLFSFIKIVILARLLNPLEFGLFGIAAIVLIFTEILTETGINPFLVQEKSNLKKFLNSTWTLSIIRGIIISALLLIISLPVSIFFNSPDSLKLIKLISIVPLFKGFINPAIIIYQKKLQFNKEFIFRTTVICFDVFVTILIVYILKSAEGLVWGMIIATIIEVVLSWIYIKPLPKLKFEVSTFRKIIKRGKYITLAGIFDYLFHNIDDIVVGKIINTASLGLYQVAYKISTLPIIEGGEIISKVVFPVYTKISGNRIRLKNAFFKVILSTSIIIIPFSLILLLFTEKIIFIILGIEWLEIVPVLKVLIIFGTIRSISGSTSALFLAVKKQEYITLVTLVSALSLLIVVIPLVKKYGLVGAAYASLFGSLLAIPFMILFTWRVLYEKS